MKHLNRFRIYFWIAVLGLGSIILHSHLQAQESGVIQTLTRGKMWLSTYEAVQFVSGTYNSVLAYPGYFNESGTHPNDLLGQPLNNWVATREGVRKRGQSNWKQYLIEMDPVIENTLVKNYNFEKSLIQPEEYSYGAVKSRADVPFADYDHPQLIFKEKRMVWSLPQYDDFVIAVSTIVNAEDQPLTDFYMNYGHPVSITPGGQNKGFNRDDEYRWLPNLRTHQDEQGAFIFYDETEVPLADPDNPVEYEISPGDQTGDRGDPGNIRDQNSIDFQLYSPQVLAMNIVDVTPNNDGEKKVYQNILVPSGVSGQVIAEDQIYQWEEWNEDYWYDRIPAEQPRLSWDEAHADLSNNDGNVFERSTPKLQLNIGPYDLAPGDSIQLIRIFVAGEMDRNIAQLGGLNATQQYLEAGIENLKQNWEAAMSLIDAWEASGRTDWNAGIEEFPPPTPADAPQVGNENELVAEAFVNPEEGTQGFDITWNPIPDSYTDPQTGENDLAGYRVYVSEQSILGSWEQVADLSVEEAEGMVSGGQVVYRYPVKAGIPMRFAVTSYDTDGNESAKTGYTFFAEAAPSAPSNDLSRVRVVPNPFKQVSGLPDVDEQKRLAFVNIPSKCTIKIFTLAGELVQTIEHDGFGQEAWGSSTENDYMLTQFFQNVMPGVYLFHVESHVSGHEGESKMGKFVIIK